MKPLKKGDTGVEVMVMQAVLRAAHFMDADGNLLRIDGVYGSRTQAAVDNYHYTACAYGDSNIHMVGDGFSLSDWYALLGVDHGDVD